MITAEHTSQKGKVVICCLGVGKAGQRQRSEVAGGVGRKEILSHHGINHLIFFYCLPV